MPSIYCIRIWFHKRRMCQSESKVPGLYKLHTAAQPIRVQNFYQIGKICSPAVIAVDCRGAVASVRDSYTDDPSSIPVRFVVASR